eukprot:scaffold244078_cov16-Prasinocladus_malaysianus.AAC.1
MDMVSELLGQDEERGQPSPTLGKLDTARRREKHIACFNLVAAFCAGKIKIVMPFALLTTAVCQGTALFCHTLEARQPTYGPFKDNYTYILFPTSF